MLHDELDARSRGLSAVSQPPFGFCDQPAGAAVTAVAPDLGEHPDRRGYDGKYYQCD